MYDWDIPSDSDCEDDAGACVDDASDADFESAVSESSTCDWDLEDFPEDGEGACDGHHLSMMAASLELANYLIDMSVKGKKMSARDVCVICHYGKAAGLRGTAADLGHNPSAQSGKFQRHIDTILKTDITLRKQYTLPLPGYDKYALARTELMVPVLPIHEVLWEDLENIPANVECEFLAEVEMGEWTDSYTHHPAVLAKEEGETIWPVALYSDGMPFQKRDGALAWYVYNMCTHTRHLVAVLRRSQVCRCGCLGWCSVYCILDWMRWCVTCLKNGSMPQSRHDASPWLPDDKERQIEAGRRRPKMAVVQIKADWAELVHVMGLCQWNAVRHPCFACHANREEMRQVHNFSCMTSPYPERSAEEYETSCSHCEILVTVADRRVHQMLIGSLHWDARKQGKKISRGRGLRRDFDLLGLKEGDRLVPNHRLRDVGKLEGCAPPFQCLFWRRGRQTFVNNRNPLFGAAAGLSVASIHLDTLHCLHLGVYRDYCTQALWSLILSDSWSTKAKGQDSLIASSVQSCRKELWAWYKAMREAYPERKLNQLEDLRVEMLGKNTKRKLSTKAAETATLLGYCVWAVRTHLCHLPPEQGKYMLAVGEALLGARDLMASGPRRLSVGDLRQLADYARRAFALRERAGIPFVPKWHLLLHLCCRAHKDGNPYFYSTYVDEDYNGKLANIASTSHRMTWFKRVLAGFRHIYSKRTLLKRRRSD